MTKTEQIKKLTIWRTLAICCLASIFANLQAQNWSVKTAINPAVDFSGVYFTTDQTGYAVGTGGAIYKTVNGGISWTAQTSGTSNALLDVYFSPNGTGYATGASGTILRTTNGGSTWNTITGIAGISTTSFNEIHFPTNNVGYFVGTGGKIVKTADGGATWNVLSSTTGFPEIKSVFFTTALIGFVSGGAGFLRKTTDGGSNWTTPSVTANNINDIYFIDNSTGYLACANGEVWQTTDTGVNWSLKNSGMGSLENLKIHFSNASNGYTTTGSSYNYLTSNGATNWIFNDVSGSGAINDLFFSSPYTGYMVGASGKLFKYQSELEPEYQPTNISFSEVFTTSMNVSYTGSVDLPTGYVVVMKSGSYSTTDPLDGISYTVNQTLGDGTIVYIGSATSISLTGLTSNTNYYFKVYAYNGAGSAINYKASTPLMGTQGTYVSGSPWTSLTSDSYWYPTDVHFYDANVGGVAAVYNLVTTNDGGQSFQGGAVTGDSYYGVYYTNSTTAYMVGSNGSSIRVIRRTVNGGSTWTDQLRTIGNSLQDVWFTNSITGFAVGAGGNILRTTNGISWSSLTSPTPNTLNAIHFPSSSVGYAVGAGGVIIKSTDGGGVWNLGISPTSNDLQGVFFTDANTGYAVGSSGTIIKTTNGGSSWVSQTSGTTNDLLEVNFSSALTGYAVGKSGTILKTVDGGNNWYAFNTGADASADYYGVYFPTSQTGYAVGYSGVNTKIYKFQSAPDPSAQPTNLIFSSITQNSLSGSFTSAAGFPAGYLVLRKADSPPTVNLLDGVEHTIGETVGDAIVAYVGSSTSFNDSGLLPGTQYYYKIYTYNFSGGSGSTNYLTTSPLTNNTLTTLLPPTATSATSLGSTGFTANWVAVSGASSYRLDLSTNGFASLVSGYNDVTVATNSLVITGLQSGTDYSYHVRAINASGASTNSNAVSVTTQPAAPVVSSATSVSTTAFTANWNASVGASGYFIDVSSNNFSGFITGYNNLAVSSITLAVSGLTAGTTYQYRVRAINAAGTSVNSTTGNVITICSSPTANVASAISGTGFTANWTATTGATNYRLDVASEPSFAFILGSYNNMTVAGTSQVVTGLTPGTAYYYRVRANNASGISSNSSAIAVTTIPNIPNALDASSVASITFIADWDDVPGATGYFLDVSTANNFSSFVSPYNNFSVGTISSSSVTVPGAGTTYYYRVRATNGSGTSVSSNVTTVNTKPATPVATAATSITATGYTANWGAVSGAATLNLEVSSDNFSTTLAGYDNLSGSATSAVITSLNSGTTYKYRIRGISSAGVESIVSNTITAITLSPAPVATTATAVSTTGFTANWNATTGASSFLLDVSLASNFTSFVSGYNGASVTGISATVSGLTIGTTYYYRLRAVNSSGTSVSSNVITVPTLSVTPTATASAINPTGFTANWNAVTGAVDYRLDVSTSNTFSSFVGSYSNLTVGGTSLVISGLTAGTTYYFRVRGSNASGSSADSNIVTVLTNPQAPVAIAATSVSTTGLTANWNAVSGATGYRLDVSSSEFVGFEVNNLAVAGTSSAVTGLTPGITYKYRVRSVNATGPSDNSNVIVTFTIPDNPVATAATSVSTTGFTANWNLISGASAYFLDVSTDVAFGSFVTSYNNRSVTGNFQIVTGLVAGTIYYYRLRAANASGTTGNSNVISTITLPTAPASLPATSVSATGFTANWSSVTGASQYNIDISTDNSFSSIISQLTASGTSVSVSALSAGTNYYYRVRASNAAGNSVNSPTINVLTFPGAPVANEATSITSTSFVASWNAMPTATSYAIDVATDATFLSPVSGYVDLSLTNTSVTLALPTPGATYFYRVRAVSAVGTSANSNVISTLIKPAAPTAATATAISETGFTANWSTVPGVSGYFLDVSSNNFNSFLPGYDNFPLTLTSQAITGLNTGSTYQYRVRSYNTTGSSSNSSTISLITIPAKPITTIATNFTTNGFTANWQTTTGAVNYRLDVASDPGFASGTLVAGYDDKVVNGTSDAVTGLTPGTIYYFRVRAVNASGTSVSSDAASSTNIPPPPVGIFTANITTTSFTANWTASSGATDYAIDVSTNNFVTFVGSYNNLNVIGTSITISGLTPGTPYQYRLRSNNNSGTSQNSGTVILETLPADPSAQPTSLVYTAITTSGMNVSFTASSGGAAGYLVIRKIGSVSTAVPIDGISYTSGTTMGDGLVVYIGSLTSFNETLLTAGTTYYYSIYAFNGSGLTINYLDTSPLQGSQVTVPPAPTVLAASLIGQNNFTANWLATSGASNYAIDVSDDDFTTLLTNYTNKLTGDVLLTTVSGLLGGTTYKYRVRAVDNAGTSLNSVEQSVLTIPDTPTGLASSGITTNSFTVAWTAITGSDNYFIDLSADNFATRPVDNLSVTTTSFTFTALASSTTYKVRVRSGNASGTSSNSETISVTTSALSGNSALAITLGNASTLTLKAASVVVEATATGGTDPKIVKFNYRKLTDVDFTTISASLKSGQTDVYQATVTKAMTDSLGSEYYFSVTDATSASKQSNHNFIYRAIDAAANVAIPFAENKFDGKPVTYQMFSVPYLLTDKNIADLFEPALNGYSNTRWRLLHYTNGAYAEYPDQVKKIELGEGYWFNTIEPDFKIALTDAQVRNDITPTTPFTMTLQKGWNQIGDPYAFNIDWETIKTANANVGLNSLWLFEDGAYVKKNVLPVWKGAFVFSDNGGLVSFPLTAKTNETGRKTLEFTSSKDHEWLLPMTLSLGELTTTFASGMHDQASVSKDKFDEIAVPRFMDYAEMTTHHPEFFAPDFAFDVVAPANSYTWIYTLHTNSTASEGTIRWDVTKLSGVNASLLLLDVANDVLVNMKTVGQYTFKLLAGQQFKVIMKDGESAPDVTSLNAAYPNPFNTDVKIPVFTETENASASVAIYNMMGQPVKTLQSSFETPGYHELHWMEASSEPGMPVNGVLLYRVTINGTTTSLKRLVKY